MDDVKNVNPETTKGFVEIAEKAVIGLLAAAYAIGLIVTNIHLNQYGVPSSVSLFRISYLTAGVWALVPIFLGIGLYYSLLGLYCYLSLLNFTLRNPDSTARKDKFIMLAVSFSFILLFAFAIHTLFSSSQKLEIQNLSVWTKAVTWGCTIGVSLPFIDKMVNLINTNSRLKLPNLVPAGIVTLAIQLILIIGAFVTYVTTFAKDAYGTIPSYVGGGKAKQVQLIINSEKPATKKQLEEIGLTFTKGTDRSSNVGLLYVMESDFIILVSQGNKQNAVTLRRDLVQAIVYEGVKDTNKT